MSSPSQSLLELADRPSFLRKVRMGAGYLPGQGEHPGTGTVVFLTLLTGLAGAQSGGLVGFAVGCAIGSAVYGPMWIAGCIGRANSALRALSNSPEEKEG